MRSVCAVYIYAHQNGWLKTNFDAKLSLGKGLQNPQKFFMQIHWQNIESKNSTAQFNTWLYKWRFECSLIKIKDTTSVKGTASRVNMLR